MSDGARRLCAAAVLACAATTMMGATPDAPALATTVGPPPCDGALPLYTKIGTLANVDGSHARAADVEARLAILRQPRAQPKAARIGWAYVDAEGDIWIALRSGDARATSDWRHVAPGIGTHSPVYALIERVGIPKGYRLSACAP